MSFADAADAAVVHVSGAADQHYGPQMKWQPPLSNGKDEAYREAAEGGEESRSGVSSRL